MARLQNTKKIDSSLFSIEIKRGQCESAAHVFCLAGNYNVSIWASSPNIFFWRFALKPHKTLTLS